MCFIRIPTMTSCFKQVTPQIWLCGGGIFRCRLEEIFYFDLYQNKSKSDLSIKTHWTVGYLIHLTKKAVFNVQNMYLIQIILQSWVHCVNGILFCLRALRVLSLGPLWLPNNRTHSSRLRFALGPLGLPNKRTYPKYPNMVRFDCQTIDRILSKVCPWSVLTSNQ